MASITSLSNNFHNLSLGSNEYDKDMFYEGQESCNSSHEGEDSDDNCEDNTSDLDIPPSNIEKTINDPYLISFARELYENNGYGSPVASFQKTYYFNGAGSYAIPHRVNHIQPASQNIAHILERWITEQLSHTGETIPILGESTQTSAINIMSMLRENFVLNGLAKVLINIRAGHVYSLHMIGDEIVMTQNCERFFQQFPLFVNVSIKVQEHSPSVRHNTCQVLIAVEHVTMKDQTTVGDIRGSENRNSIHIPCKFSNNTRVISSPDGQIFCLLEEIMM